MSAAGLSLARFKVLLQLNDRGAMKNEAAVFIRRFIPYRNPASADRYGTT